MDMPMKDAKWIRLQNHVLCIIINSKTAKRIIDIRRPSVSECTGDFLDLNPIQEVLKYHGDELCVIA